MDLRSEARRQDRPATWVVREAVSGYLRQKQAEERHRRIAAYAAEAAGTADDLDEALEEAAAEQLEDEDVER